MNNQEMTNSQTSPTISTQEKSIGDLKELINLCIEMKIDQLKMPDGTCIVMNQLAFYKETAGETQETQQKPNHSSDFKLESTESLDDTMDEDLLYSSAIG